MGNKGLQPVCLFLATFPSIVCVSIVTIRILIRSKQKLLGLEDALLAIATVLNLVLSFTTCGYIRTSYYGYHFHEIPYNAVNQIVAMKWNYANSCIYNPILALVKVSFMWTLIRLRSPGKWINRCLWATLIINGCFAIAAPLVCFLQCNPISRYWDGSTPGKCVNPGAYIVSTSSIVLATDVLILLMPTWILHDLKIPIRRKLMAIAFLSFGVAVTIVGAVRTSVLVKIFVIGQLDPDPTYGVNYTLSNIESALAIIGVCGPTIKHVLSFCIPILRTRDETSSRDYNYPHTIGSQGTSRNRRHDMGVHTRIYKDLDREESFGKDWSRADVELTTVDGGEALSRQHTTSDENLVITKTVAWKVEASQKDSDSTHEHSFNTPHTVL